MHGGHPRPLTAAQQFLNLRINSICAGTGTLHAGRLVCTSPTPLRRENEVRIDYRQGDVPTVFIDEPERGSRRVKFAIFQSSPSPQPLLIELGHLLCDIAPADVRRGQPQSDPHRYAREPGWHDRDLPDQQILEAKNPGHTAPPLQ
jgi:hypothetical protein